MTEIELKNEIDRLAKLIGAPKSSVPPIESRSIEDKLVIILEDNLIRVTYKERGSDLDHVSTTSTDDALYWIFRRMVVSMAIAEDITSEYAGLDKRRYWHKRTVQMFRAAKNQDWLIKRETEIEEILRNAPYKDDV